MGGYEFGLEAQLTVKWFLAIPGDPRALTGPACVYG